MARGGNYAKIWGKSTKYEEKPLKKWFIKAF
jgi:hypothetical protein